MTSEPRASTLGQLLGAVSDDLRTLAAQTLTLARLEIRTATSALVWSGLGVAVSILIAIAGASFW